MCIYVPGMNDQRGEPSLVWAGVGIDNVQVNTVMGAMQACKITVDSQQLCVLGWQYLVQVH
jgi:hypothetical protein